MIYVFLYHSKEGQAKGSLFFLNHAVSQYLKKTSCGAVTKSSDSECWETPAEIERPYCKPVVLKDEKGRPFVESEPFYVSASHSKEWVACAVSDSRTGIDIEEKRATDGLRILRRFGTPEESGFLEEEGPAAFFEIWCRKEAYSKYVGEGLSYGFGRINTCSEICGKNGRSFILSEKINGVKIRSGLMPFDETVFFAVAGEGEICWEICGGYENG